MSIWEIIVSALVFVAIVSVDIFVCGFAYGADKTRMPFIKVLLINIIGKIMIGIGLFTGYFLGHVIPETVTTWLSFGVLFTLGLFKLGVWLWSLYKNKPAEITAITWKETAILGFALSLDGFALGIGTTISKLSLAFIFTIIGISLFTDQLIFTFGQFIGHKVTKKVRLDLSWLCALFLIIVAVTRLFI